MSLTRPLRALRVHAGVRALSGSSKVSSESYEPVPTGMRRTKGGGSPHPSLVPSLGSLTPADIHKRIVPRVQVERSPAFKTRFEDAPLHELINESPLFTDPPFKPIPKGEKGSSVHTTAAITGLESTEVRKLSTYKMVVKSVTKMTKKGKIRSFLVYAIAGSPSKGLVGIGRGRGTEARDAAEKAVDKAMLSMDYVNRFENRTLWGQGADLTCKFSSTQVTMRARPPGFGLQVPHVLHRLFSAAGIRDASATIEGSRNPVTVMKAALQILHGGFNPVGMGNGAGSKGRRSDKGMGMRSVRDIERQRGRFGVDVDKRL